MFLFLVHSVLVTLLRYSHIRIHCVTLYLPTNASVNTQNACSSLIPIVSIRLASLPTSQRRKVRMLFEKRGKCHVSSDSQCFYVRSSSSDSFVVTYSLCCVLMSTPIHNFNGQPTHTLRHWYTSARSQEVGDLCRLRQSLHEASLLGRCFASLEEIQVMWKYGGYYLQQWIQIGMFRPIRVSRPH
jgi:hypothetical protein